MTVINPGQFCVELQSGKYLDVTAPDYTQITLADISIPLSKTARYGGANRGFFSVAEHAVLVAKTLRSMNAPLHLQFAGLHHDDAEFCLGDIQRPVKLAIESLLPIGVNPYKKLTEALDLAIWRALGGIPGDAGFWIPRDLHDELVKKVDTWACWHEASILMPSKAQGWEQTWLARATDILVPKPEPILCLDWIDADLAYRRMHKFLVAEATGERRLVAGGVQHGRGEDIMTWAARTRYGIDPPPWSDESGHK